MRFQVPQFLEVEDKVFGPLTFKQFIYLAGGAGLITVLASFLPRFLAVLFSIPVGILSLALAFYKVNNKPFVELAESFFSFASGNKLYIWKKTPKKVAAKKERAGEDNLGLFVPRLSDSKLKDLTWSLGVSKNIDTSTKNTVTRQAANTSVARNYGEKQN